MSVYRQYMSIFVSSSKIEIVFECADGRYRPMPCQKDKYGDSLPLILFPPSYHLSVLIIYETVRKIIFLDPDSGLKLREGTYVYI